MKASHLQVHNFCALVDTDGEGVVVFGGHQDLLEGFADALSALGGFLDQNLLKSHDKDDEDIPKKSFSKFVARGNPKESRVLTNLHAPCFILSNSCGQ